LVAWLLGCLFPAFKSGAKATAIQTLRANRTTSCHAERLDCVRFTAAFARASTDDGARITEHKILTK